MVSVAWQDFMPASDDAVQTYLPASHWATVFTTSLPRFPSWLTVMLSPDWTGRPFFNLEFYNINNDSYFHCFG